ncbi:Fic family protein [Nocardia panacis]|uniref:Fic family protein n=1 Tax=Nocardia panacis TaxID=2340916 RepID=A0A3A4K3L1_9NOCA|nr:Fic family protein [Nocardia panacis]RJO74803.1 Fic family protein [Nocardia panacis]
MLYRTPDLDAQDEKVLSEIEDFRNRLSYLVGEPQRWDRPLRRNLVARAIVGSNTIEGYTISLNDAESLVAGSESLSVESDDTALAAVAGYHEALTYVQQSAHSENFAYEQMLLSALHFMMLRHRLDKWPGRYRGGGIMVTGGRHRPPAYIGPEAPRVPELMAELVAWLQNADGDRPAYVRAAMAHLNLVSIHPWRDGNGRMARCLHTLVLARNQVLAPEFSSIEEWLGASTMNTAEYYSALSRVQGGSYLPERDTHEWVRFCLRAHHLQAQVVDQRVRTANTLWHKAIELTSEFGLHERTAIALFAAAEGNLRRATYALDEDLTRDQALRDLNLLQRLQLIQTAGTGVRRHYLATGRWRDTVQQLQAQAEVLREPYR